MTERFVSEGSAEERHYMTLERQNKSREINEEGSKDEVEDGGGRSCREFTGGGFRTRLHNSTILGGQMPSAFANRGSRSYDEHKR